MTRRNPASSSTREAMAVPNHIPAAKNATPRLILALAWLIVFCAVFYSFGLPNNRFVLSETGTTVRWMVWKVLPFDLMDLVDPQVEPNAPPWSWLFLGQRIPFLVIACLVWAGAFCFGRLQLRVLRVCSAFDRAERVFFSSCLGLATVSLMMLGLGLLGLMSRWPLLGLLLAGCLLELWLTRRDFRETKFRGLTPPGSSEDAEDGSRPALWLPWMVLSVVTPFVFCMLLGAMSPQTDFDVIEYHLGGPKEWFQQGRIARLPHNVYTSFPFLTEMLVLCGMVLFGDWQWGALAGQAVIAGFVPLTAIGLYATGRRWFSESAGWLAALLWLTTPWVYRISIIAYAEGGLACYLFAAFAVSLRIVCSDKEDADVSRMPGVGARRVAGAGAQGVAGAGAQGVAGVGASPRSPGAAVDSQTGASRGRSSPGHPMVSGLYILCGLLAGSAMACKYTGLISVVLPVGALLAWSAMRSADGTARVQRLVLAVSLFGAGVALAIGPWLLKNVVETGNPVFPLAYSIFGGEGRDAKMDAQWRRGHSRHYTSQLERLQDLPVKLTDVAANNDWHSALMFGLAPIALLAGSRKKVWSVWAFIGWQFMSWFLFTHQIDRFYVPMFPAVALLAGCGASWLMEFSPGRWCGAVVMTASILFNAWIMQKQSVSGFNAGRLDLNMAADLVTSPSQRWLAAEVASGRLPRDVKVLCVGEAALFHATFPYVYNTVFDRSLFEQWFAERTESGGFRLRSTEQIRETLRHNGITHVLVNWAEILRYREPGSYGYTDFAHPDWFAKLQAAGVLGPPLSVPDEASFMPVQNEAERRRVEAWAPSLGASLADRPGYRAIQVFPVRP